jgi:hypothetical protein
MKKICTSAGFVMLVMMILSTGLTAATSDGKLKPSTTFESGAADSVRLRDDGMVAFLIPPDPGGPEYLWFHFALTNPIKKGQQFVIENAAGAHQTGDRWGITKPVFSADGKTWVRALETDYSREFSLRHPLGRQVFSFQSPLDAESLRVACSYPYTSDDLNSYLKAIENRLTGGISTLGKSEEGRELVCFRIGPEPPVESQLPVEIWVICREHPGETPASFVLEGMVAALLEHPAGKRLRDEFVFNFVPMLNVDGVAHGYYYHNARGVNLARDWVSYNSLEARRMHAALSSAAQRKQLRLVINLHSSNDPHLGHFFLEMPSSQLYPLVAQFQQNLYQAAEGNFAQLQGRSTVRMLDFAGITGNAIYREFAVYTIYLESNYSRGADGSPVTPQSLRETGQALIQALAEILMGE